MVGSTLSHFLIFISYGCIVKFKSFRRYVLAVYHKNIECGVNNFVESIGFPLLGSIQFLVTFLTLNSRKNL